MGHLGNQWEPRYRIQAWTAVDAQGIKGLKVFVVICLDRNYCVLQRVFCKYEQNVEKNLQKLFCFLRFQSHKKFVAPPAVSAVGITA